MLGSSVGIGLGPPAVAPVDRDFWVTPAPRPGASIFVQPVVFLSGGPDGAHNCPWYRGSTAPGLIQAFNPLDADDPVYETSTGELPLDLGPASLFAKFVNTSSWVSLRQLAAAWTWTFHSPGGDGPQAPGGTVGYRLLANGEPVSSGVTPQSGFGGPFLPFVYPLTARAYVFETDPLRHWVGGLRADVARRGVVRPEPAIRATSTRRTCAASRSERRRARRGGAGRGTAPRAGRGARRRRRAGRAVSSRASWAASRRPVPLVALGGGVFEASMAGACDAAGPVNLVVAVVDAAGNELREWLTPAFVCRGSTCGNGTLERGRGLRRRQPRVGRRLQRRLLEHRGVRRRRARRGRGLRRRQHQRRRLLLCYLSAGGGGDDVRRRTLLQRRGRLRRTRRVLAPRRRSVRGWSRVLRASATSWPTPVASRPPERPAAATATPAPTTRATAPARARTRRTAVRATTACSATAPTPAPRARAARTPAIRASAAPSAPTSVRRPTAPASRSAPAATTASPAPCDVCNGAGTCSHYPAYPGFVCRPATEPCDVPEVCDGVAAACPIDSGHRRR